MQIIESLSEIKHIFVFVWFAINEFIFKRYERSNMYNITTHSTTGVPQMSLFNGVIRDKLPGMQDLTGKYVDSAEKHQDCINKHKFKAIGFDRSKIIKKTS